MDAGSSLGLAIEQVRELGISQVRIGNDQGIASVAFGIGRGEQHGTGLGLRQKLAVLGIGQELSVSGLASCKVARPVMTLASAPRKVAPRALGQLAEGKCHRHA